MQEKGLVAPGAPILNIPTEIIDNIFYHLDAYDLTALGATCVFLRRHAFADLHWQRCVQENVPGAKIVSPGPCTNYRHLYLLHDRLWFLPKFKIWFCDRDLAGKLILARYDPHRGCIEAYQLLALLGPSWPGQPHFQPGVDPQHFSNADLGSVVFPDGPSGAHVRLYHERPVLQFRGRAQDGQVDEFSHRKRPRPNRYAEEIPMALDDRLSGMFSNFMLARPLEQNEVDRCISARPPYDSVWPPAAVPAPHRVSRARPGQYRVALSVLDRPQSRSQVSDQTFRIRRWIELAGTPSSPVHMRHGPTLAAGVVNAVSVVGGEHGHPVHTALGSGIGVGNGSGSSSSSSSNPTSNHPHAPYHSHVHPQGALGPERGSHIGAHIGEEIITYSTLDPELYTPTPTKPWRGIWVGDYGSHGLEFLLIHQPDDPPATDADLGLVHCPLESDEEWEKRRLETRINRGRLEGIKLTGDPNVPRGEFTFIVDDLGPAGLVGINNQGNRIVRGRGHIAATGFLRDKYIQCWLNLLGHDRIALYWVELDSWSFLQKIDIDSFLQC